MRALSIIILASLLTAGVGIGADLKAPMDCTFTVQGTFNGTVVDIQVTVSDVTLIECTLLKLGVKKALK